MCEFAEGIEFVEVIEAIEDSFGVHYAEDDLGTIITVGDLCNSVLYKIGTETTNTCLSSFVFYKLRYCLMEKLGIEKKMIKSDANLNHLVPAKKRRILLKDMGSILGLKMPQMVMSVLVSLMFFSGSAILLLSLFISKFTEFYPDLMRIDIIIICILVIVIRLDKGIFPGKNLGDFIKLIIALNFKKLSRETGTIRRDDVILAVKWIIATQNGKDIEKISLENRLIRA